MSILNMPLNTFTTIIVKIFIVTICIICPFIKSMDGENHPHYVTLAISPTTNYSFIGFTGYPDVHGNMLACLSGFSDEDNKITVLLNEGATCHTSDGHSYTPENIVQALKEKKIAEYPLDWHRQAVLQGNEHLVLLKVFADRSQMPIDMPAALRKRMLLYLGYDVTERHGKGFDLCNEVALEHAQPGEQVNQCASLMEYIDFVEHESHFMPGDVVGLATGKKDGFSSILKLKNYALALGDGMYMSKLANGGALYMSDLQSLKIFWKCDGCVKINPAIGKRNDFLANAFRSIVYRKITMDIYPHKERSITIGSVPVDYLMTWLFGFRHVNKQVILRTDNTVAGSCDDVDFSTTKELDDLLFKGVISGYPLQVHKQLSYLVGDEVLDIQMFNSDGNGKCIYLPSSIKKKLFTYLMNDNGDMSKQCFTFCKELCLEDFEDHEMLDESISYADQYSHIDENALKPGDPLMFNSMKHFAIALGDGMYLSQLGNGSPFLVTNMETMRNVYSCKRFVKIKPTITRYKKFWRDLYQRELQNLRIGFPCV